MVSEKFIVYRIIKMLFGPVFKVFYRPVITGKEYIPENGRIIIAGNHKHALDPILVDICTDRIVRTLAKKDLHDGPFGFMFRAAGTIPVDLHSSRNRAALDAAVEVLKNDGVINLSPEAKRNYTDELLLPFKYGAVSMAEKTGAMIIPYSITGNYKAFKERIRINFGKPFSTEGMALTDANRELYNRILELMKENTDSSVLETKHITTFDDWSRKNEQTQTS